MLQLQEELLPHDPQEYIRRLRDLYDARDRARGEEVDDREVVTDVGTMTMTMVVGLGVRHPAIP